MDARRRGGRGFAVPAGLLVAALAVLSVACTLGPTARYAAVTAANLVPLGVLAHQLRRGSGLSRPAWSAMLAGTGSLAVHNVLNEVALASTGAPASGPVAAGTLAAGYALLLPGGAAAVRPRARPDLGATLDAALIGLAAATLMWAAALHPAHVRLGSSALTMAYELVLVLLVTALTGAVVRAAAVHRAARAVAAVLLVAMVATDLSDVAYTLTQDPETGFSAWWASAMAVLALLAFAAALVHPSAAAVPLADHEDRGLTRPRLAFLGAALSVNPALAGVQLVLGHPVDVALLIVASLVTVPLVVWRIGLLARSNADAVRRLHELASLDELTGLPNRRAVTAHLDRLLCRVAGAASPGAVVLYLDLDDFKAVNDTHGHPTGDRLLRAVAGRLRACVRASDVVARLGGDEFVVVVEGDPETVAPVAAASIDRALAQPLALGSVTVSGRSSIGTAAVHPGERADAAIVLSRADAQMYAAKRARRSEPSSVPNDSCPAAVVSME